MFKNILEFLSKLESIFSDAASVTGDVGSVFGAIDSVAKAGSDIAGAGSTLALSAVFMVLFGVFVINILLDIVVYLFRTVCLYKLAKNAGRTDGWLAFIPIAWHFVLCDLSDRPFELFGKRWFNDRRKAFWVWLGVKYLGAWIVGLISGVIVSILMLLPVVGSLLASVVGIALPFVPLFLSAAMRYRFLYDATEVFKPGARNNKTLAMISIVVEELLSTDLMTLLLLWSMVRCKPAKQA